MKKATFCILILLSCLALSLFAQGTSPDERAIREIIDQFTPMWTTPDGVAVFQRFSSDTHFMMLLADSVLSRDDFTRLLAEMLQNNPPVRHTHTIKKIVVSGALAFEHGTMELVRENGQTATSEPLNVFFREESGWKLIMTMPGVEIRSVIY
jgi:ketosteroid isomerase-like protein